MQQSVMSSFAGTLLSILVELAMRGISASFRQQCQTHARDKTVAFCTLFKLWSGQCGIIVGEHIVNCELKDWIYEDEREKD